MTENVLQDPSSKIKSAKLLKEAFGENGTTKTIKSVSLTKKVIKNQPIIILLFDYSLKSEHDFSKGISVEAVRLVLILFHFPSLLSLITYLNNEKMVET